MLQKWHTKEEAAVEFGGKYKRTYPTAAGREGEEGEGMLCVLLFFIKLPIDWLIKFSVTLIKRLFKISRF
jgi:hypothetical protein